MLYFVGAVLRRCCTSSALWFVGRVIRYCCDACDWRTAGIGSPGESDHGFRRNDTTQTPSWWGRISRSVCENRTPFTSHHPNMTDGRRSVFCRSPKSSSFQSQNFKARFCLIGHFGSSPIRQKDRCFAVCRHPSVGHESAVILRTQLELIHCKAPSSGIEPPKCGDISVSETQVSRGNRRSRLSQTVVEISRDDGNGRPIVVRPQLELPTSSERMTLKCLLQPKLARSGRRNFDACG